MAKAAPPGAFMTRQVGHLLRRAYGRARRNSAAALANLGEVSPVQASALAALMPGPLTQAELGRRIDMEPANTLTLVRRLGTSGLVERLRDPANKRVVLIGLTTAGAEMAARLERALARSAAATLAPLSPDERTLLLDLLERIAQD